MIRIILQFTLRIAFRCVLHRRENQEIHRTEDIGIWRVSRPLGTLTTGSDVCSGLRVKPTPSRRGRLIITDGERTCFTI